MPDYEVHRLVVLAEDDLVSILNNIPSNTEVILREGTHNVASQIILGDGVSTLANVKVRGSEASILNITYSGDNPIAVQAPAADITFEGFHVTYNGSASGQTPLFAPIGSGGDDIYRLEVRNIHCEFASGAITFVRWDNEDIDVYGIAVSGCSLYGSNTKGLFRVDMAANRTLQNVRILNNFVDRDTAGGSQCTAIYGDSGATVEDVVIAHNSFRNIQEAIWLDFSSGTCRDMQWSLNTIVFIDSGNAGCYIDGDVEKVIITGNIFNRTGASYCLYVESGSYFNVSDNHFINSPDEGLIVGSGVTHSTFDNNTATNCAAEGFQIDGDNNRISNNVSENNDYGIRESSGASGNHYVGNTCRNNVTADKLLEGSNRRQGVNYW